MESNGGHKEQSNPKDLDEVNKLTFFFEPVWLFLIFQNFLRKKSILIK